MHLAIIFAAGFFTVFLLGFQSRCVNHGNKWLAAGCSFTIAMVQTSLWTGLFHDSSWAAALTYGLSGSLAITSSMWVHQRWLKPSLEKQLLALGPGEMLALAMALTAHARKAK